MAIRKPPSDQEAPVVRGQGEFAVIELDLDDLLDGQDLSTGGLELLPSDEAPGRALVRDVALRRHSASERAQT